MYKVQKEHRESKINSLVTRIHNHVSGKRGGREGYTEMTGFMVSQMERNGASR